MRLVERHVIKRADPRFPVIDRAALASKHLYNTALSATRQVLIQTGSYPTYPTLYSSHEPVVCATYLCRCAHDESTRERNIQAEKLRMEYQYQAKIASRCAVAGSRWQGRQAA